MTCALKDHHTSPLGWVWVGTEMVVEIIPKLLGEGHCDLW